LKKRSSRKDTKNSLRESSLLGMSAKRDFCVKLAQAKERTRLRQKKNTSTEGAAHQRSRSKLDRRRMSAQKNSIKAFKQGGPPKISTKTTPAKKKIAAGEKHLQFLTSGRGEESLSSGRKPVGTKGTGLDKKRKCAQLGKNSDARTARKKTAKKRVALEGTKKVNIVKERPPAEKKNDDVNPS